MPVFNIQLVLLLAVVFAGGTWLGWLLRREQSEQVHNTKAERRTEQLDAQCATIERVTRERDDMRERHRESQAMVHRHKRQLQSLREAVDELSTDKRRLLRNKEKLTKAYTDATRDHRRMDRQLKLLIKRTAAERLERSRDTGRRRRATDELQQIRGIGPALAAKLRGMGVEKLTDIAELDELAVARLDKQLTFRGRIRRDQWIEQAQALLSRDDSVSA